MDFVAAYAALVATSGVGWQIFAEVRAGRTRLKISLGNTWSFEGPPTVEDQMLAVRIVNLSRHDVQMPGITVFQPSIQRAWPICDDDVVDDSLQVLPARSSHLIRVSLDRFIGLKTGETVVADAVTATGERFRAAPLTITRLD
jgi:hypothetical protein